MISNYVILSVPLSAISSSSTEECFLNVFVRGSLCVEFISLADLLNQGLTFLDVLHEHVELLHRFCVTLHAQELLDRCAECFLFLELLLSLQFLFLYVHHIEMLLFLLIEQHDVVLKERLDPAPNLFRFRQILIRW